MSKDLNKRRFAGRVWRAVMVTLLLCCAQATYGAAWTNWYKVSQVYPASGGQIYVRLETQELFGCTTSSWYYIYNTNAAKKEILAVLLSAAVSGQKVRLYMNGCQTYPVIQHIWLDALS